MKLKTLFEDDGAVSPVIGVILMVAITVILAAVIGTFVLGMGEDINQNAQAGVSFSESPNGGDTDVEVQLTSLGNVDGASSVYVEQTGCTGMSGGTVTDGDRHFDSVGDTITAEACSGGKITVIAELDGNENVIANHDV